MKSQTKKNEKKVERGKYHTAVLFVTAVNTVHFSIAPFKSIRRQHKKCTSKIVQILSSTRKTNLLSIRMQSALAQANSMAGLHACKVKVVE